MKLQTALEEVLLQKDQLDLALTKREKPACLPLMLHTDITKVLAGFEVPLFRASFVFHSRIAAIYKLLCPLVRYEQWLTFTSDVKEWIAMSENVDGEQRARLWEYRLHVENQ